VNISEELNISDQQLALVLEKHPYFQLGLIAKSKKLRSENHIDSLKSIRKCAISFPDRALLHRYLHEEEISPDQNTDQPNDASKEPLEIVEEKAIEMAVPLEEVSEEYEPAVESTTESQNEKEEGEIIKSEEERLAKEYLIEAVNQSIQLEAQQYDISKLPIETDSIKDGDKGDTILSFTEWLDGAKGPITPVNEDHLIDKFIQESPQISRLSEQSFYSPIEKGKESISEDKLVYTETLARIFVQQGNKSQAIKAYHYLMLKNPQKSVYFADLIKKLEE
jgi:hypothetical protein